MSYQICVAQAVNCVFVRHLEFILGVGLTAINEAVEHADFKSGMNILRDTQTIEHPDYMDYNWFKNDFDGIYREEHLLMQGSKFAWVVGSSADYAKAHSWALVTRTMQGQNRMAFRQVSLAFDWLGIPP
ncbi:MAG: hypothetical protein QGF68_20850, partial [Nitrospinota bacterium]|nr:hypothetical protein [Nitrospinota bacterium]